MGGAQPDQAPVLSRPQRWLLVASFVAGVALLVPGLFEPLWIDDVLRTFSTHVDSEDWWQWVLGDVHNPLYNVFMRGWIHVFGDSPPSIRIPTALAALLTAAMASLWAVRRFGGWTGVGFAAILLANPAFILHATMAKNNLFSVLFATGAIVAHDLVRQDRRGRWIALAIVASGLGIYTDFAILYVLLPVWSAIAVEAAVRKRTADLKALAIVVGAAALLTIPLLLLKVPHAEGFERSYLRHFSIGEVWHLLFNWMLWGNALLPLPEHLRLISGVGLVIGGPLLVVGVRSLWRSPTGRMLLAVLVLPILATFAASAVIYARNSTGTSFIYQERNLLVILPVYLLTLVVGGLTMRPAWLGRWLLGLLIALNLTGAVLQWTVHAEVLTSYWPRRDYGAMAREIESQFERMEPPHLLVSVPPLSPTVYHHRHRDDIHYWRRWRRYPTRFVDVRTAANEAGADELLLLVVRDEAANTVRLDLIEQRWPTEHVAFISGLDLYKVSRPGRKRRRRGGGRRIGDP